MKDLEKTLDEPNGKRNGGAERLRLIKFTDMGFTTEIKDCPHDELWATLWLVGYGSDPNVKPPMQPPPASQQKLEYCLNCGVVRKG